MGLVEYIKSLKISIREKIYSVNNFGLLDVLNYLFCFKYLISAFIFIIYIINAINGLNIDYKALLKIFEECGVRDLINSQWGIGMHYLDDIDYNFKRNNDSISNNIFAANNNTGNENSNQNERGSSPVDVTIMPRHMSPIEGANESSDEDSCAYSSDEGEKKPSEENGFNPEYSKREVRSEEIRLERRCIRMDIDDAVTQRNVQVDAAIEQLGRAEIYEETITKKTRTWNERDSDSDSDKDDRSTIVDKESVIIKSKKAKFANPAEKQEFLDTIKKVEKKSRKIARLAEEYNKLGEEKKDCESNTEGKMNNITKALNNAFTKK